MPARATADGAHTPFTDHQIRRRPAATSPARTPALLAAWRPPPHEYTKRNLGLAYVYAGEAKHSAEMLNKAFPLLADAQQAFPKDPDVIAGLALVLQLKGLYHNAAQAFELAAKLRRKDVRFLLNAATARLAAGDLESALERDPYDEAAYRLLADVYRRAGRRRDEIALIESFLRISPESIHFRARKIAMTDLN